jgi:hypothetical protein
MDIRGVDRDAWLLVDSASIKPVSKTFFGPPAMGTN